MVKHSGTGGIAHQCGGVDSRRRGDTRRNDALLDGVGSCGCARGCVGPGNHVEQHLPRGSISLMSQTKGDSICQLP